MMPERKLTFSVLEGIFYGILGTIFVFSILLLKDYFRTDEITNFADDAPQITLALAWLLLGLSIPALFWNVIFRKSINRFFLKWFLVLMSSSVTPVLMQMTFLMYRNDRSWKLLGVWWMIKLFIILTPFTILFANRHLLIEKLQNRNALK